MIPDGVISRNVLINIPDDVYNGTRTECIDGGGHS